MTSIEPLPTAFAVAWATPTDLFVSVPSRTGPSYTLRYPRTAEGLAAALNILIDHAERPANAKARLAPPTHPAIRRPMVTINEAEREAARSALKKVGII